MSFYKQNDFSEYYLFEKSVLRQYLCNLFIVKKVLLIKRRLNIIKKDLQI